jgi:hypothetical protein
MAVGCCQQVKLAHRIARVTLLLEKPGELASRVEVLRVAVSA